MWKIGVFGLLVVCAAGAAQLKQETLNAWNEYLAGQNVAVLQRARSSGQFLWSDENEARREQISSGLVVVQPVQSRSPRKAPSGLIHHWIGSVFIPNASADDVIAVIRDYSHYKDVYQPGVADATPIQLQQAKDEFAIRFVNASVLSRTSLEGHYVSDFVRVGEKRWYSTSATTRMQEIKDFGHPNEVRLPPGTGSGYIWRLYSTMRMEERAGGVIVELEAIALSRDVPLAIHWIADPIIRRVSHDSLEKSLQATAAAVRARTVTQLRSSR